MDALITEMLEQVLADTVVGPLLIYLMTQSACLSFSLNCDPFGLPFFFSFGEDLYMKYKDEQVGMLINLISAVKPVSHFISVMIIVKSVKYFCFCVLFFLNLAWLK